jgi:hypothetical protein
MQNAEQRVLVLGDAEYDLDAVIKIGASGPLIKITAEEINETNNGQYPEHVVAFKPEAVSEEMNNRSSMLFYKQHGKFTILVGRETYDRLKTEKNFPGTVSGRLLSSPALKKAKLIEYVEGEIIEERPAQEHRTSRYDSRFGNGKPPRYNDGRA